MTSFIYNHITTKWDAVQADTVAPDVYLVPNLPGDDEKYLEIPPEKAHDPRVLKTLARFRPPLADTAGNGQFTPRPKNSNGARKRSIFEPENGTKLDCDQVRLRITALIDSGVKVSEFTRSLNVSNPSYYRFMGQNGPDKGSGSDVYMEAMRYFLHYFPHGQEEAATTPTAKRRRSSVSNGSSADSDIMLSTLPRPSISHSFSSTSTTSPLSLGPPNPLFDPLPSVRDVVLENELSDSYEPTITCDQVRVLIDQYFTSTKDTQAAFLRTLMAQYHTEDKKIQSVQLQRFRGMKGETAGSTNPVFYAGSVFFEKLRRAKARDQERADRGELLDEHTV